MKPQLSSSHRRTYDGILRHPAARNPDGREERSTLGALAEITEKHLAEDELLARGWDLYSSIAQSGTTQST